MTTKQRVFIAGGGPAGNLFCMIFSRLGWEITQAVSDWIPPQRKHIHILKKRILDISKDIDARLHLAVESAVEKDYINLEDGKPIFWLSQAKLIEGLKHLVSGMSEPATFSVNNLTKEVAESFDMLIDATGPRMKLARQCEEIGLGQLIVDDTGSFNQFTTSIYKYKNTDRGVWINKSEDGVIYAEVAEGVLTITTDFMLLANEKFPSFILDSIAKKPIETHSYGAPNIRRSNWRGHPLMRVGDALVQLPAQTGFGFTSIFEQGLLCASLAPHQMETGLNDFAERLWMGTIAQFTFNQHFSSTK